MPFEKAIPSFASRLLSRLVREGRSEEESGRDEFFMAKVKIPADKQHEFLKREFAPLLNELHTWSKIAKRIFFTRSMMHAWLHGKAVPSALAIAKIAIVLAETTGEDVSVILDRWASFFCKSSLKGAQNAAMLKIAMHEVSCYTYLLNQDLLPMIKVVAQVEALEKISAKDLEFLFEIQSKIGYPLKPDTIIPLLELRAEQA